MQSRNPIFADFADLMTDAFGAAQSAGQEARSVFRAQVERMVSELDLVTREEFDALKARVDALAAQNESLREQLAAKPVKKPAASARPAAGRKSSAQKKS